MSPASAVCTPAFYFPNAICCSEPGWTQASVQHALLLDSTLAVHSTVRVQRLQRRQQAQYKLQRLGSGLLLFITPT